MSDAGAYHMNVTQLLSTLNKTDDVVFQQDGVGKEQRTLKVYQSDVPAFGPTVQRHVAPDPGITEDGPGLSGRHFALFWLVMALYAVCYSHQEPAVTDLSCASFLVMSL